MGSVNDEIRLANYCCGNCAHLRVSIRWLARLAANVFDEIYEADEYEFMQRRLRLQQQENNCAIIRGQRKLHHHNFSNQPSAVRV